MARTITPERWRIDLLQVRKYAVTRKELEEFKKKPGGKHVTTQATGRLPSPDKAKNKYGLSRTPKYVLTGSARNLVVDGKGHDKARGEELIL